MKLIQRFKANPQFLKIYVISLVVWYLGVPLLMPIIDYFDDDMYSSGNWSGNISGYVLLQIAIIVIIERRIHLSYIYTVGMTFSAMMVFVFVAIPQYSFMELSFERLGSFSFFTAMYICPIILGIWGIIVVTLINKTEKASSNTTTAQGTLISK